MRRTAPPGSGPRAQGARSRRRLTLRTDRQRPDAPGSSPGFVSRPEGERRRLQTVDTAPCIKPDRRPSPRSRANGRSCRCGPNFSRTSPLRWACTRAGGRRDRACCWSRWSAPSDGGATPSWRAIRRQSWSPTTPGCMSMIWRARGSPIGGPVATIAAAGCAQGRGAGASAPRGPKTSAAHRRADGLPRLRSGDAAGGHPVAGAGSRALPADRPARRSTAPWCSTTGGSGCSSWPTAARSLRRRRRGARGARRQGRLGVAAAAGDRIPGRRRAGRRRRT